MSRPRSSAGYSRPKSNSGQDTESVNSNGGNGSRAKAAPERPNSRAQGDTSKSKRQIVGQYMIGKTIGEGTFGKVKLAVHIPTGEKVAIKILEKSRIKEQADVRRVNREIKILKKARHGNIIQLYEVLDTKNTIYLIMECAEGGEMFDFIVAQKRVEERQACKFFHQIIDGIEVIHRNEITHRDLKPENLLLKATPDGWVVKIVDFGLSNTHEGGKLLATACGSPCYAAPEMIAGKKYFGPLADMWSIGVILFALVSGYLPFEDPNTAVLYKKILAGDYQTPKWISPEVKDLIACILEVDPKKRYTVENVRKHPWYNIVSESSIPRDLCTTTETSRTETLNIMVKAGMDAQAVLDGVASQAFNGLTAMYYLLEQKHHAKRLKKAESSKTQIRQNSSNLSKPETGSDTNDAGKLQAAAPVVGQPPLHAPPQHQHAPPQYAPPQHAPPPHAQHHQQGHKAPAPLKLMSIEPLAPISTLVERAPKEEKNVPIKTFVPVTPYLQTPFILQQQQQQNQRQQQHSHMPSLDAYLRGGMELPVGTAPKADVPAAEQPQEQHAKPNVGSVVVPPLNLRTNKNNGGNSTSAAVAVATGSLLGNKPVLTSQTARGPATTLHPLAHAPNEGSTAAHPQSARAAAPSDLPGDIPERPNTRRSHLRSRGGEAHTELAPAEVVAPGVGLDSMPPTRETAPQMAVRRPEGAVPSTNIKAIVSANADDTPAAAMSLLVISQKKNITDSSLAQNSTPSPTAQVSATPIAPEAPKSSGASGSGAFAGRRGKNITNAAGAGAAPAQPASSNAPVSGGTQVSTSATTSAHAPTVTVVPLVSPMGVQPAPPVGGRPRPQPSQQSSAPPAVGQPALAPIQPSTKPTAPQ